MSDEMMADEAASAGDQNLHDAPLTRGIIGVNPQAAAHRSQRGSRTVGDEVSGYGRKCRRPGGCNICSNRIDDQQSPLMNTFRPNARLPK